MAIFNWPWNSSKTSSSQQQVDSQEDFFNLANNKTKPMDLVSKKSIQNFIVKAVGFVTAQTQRRELFTRPEFNLAEIRDASEADSYVKISLSKYSYLIYKAGWKFKSENQQAIDYLEQRFRIMSYCTGVPMDILMQGIADDLVRYSNAFLLKSRVDRIPGVKAQPITEDGQIVGGYTRVDPCSIRIKRDKHGKHYGYYPAAVCNVKYVKQFVKCKAQRKAYNNEGCNHTVLFCFGNKNGDKHSKKTNC